MADFRNLLDHIIEKGGSDLHLTVGLPPMMRFSGQLVPMSDEVLDEEEAARLIGEFLPDSHRPEFESKGSTDFAIAHGEDRFRASVLKQKGLHGAVLRLIPKDLLSLEQIGLPDQVTELLTRPRGLILVTGPTGSGKTTTLASMIDFINERFQRHIITIEDPVEYYHKHKNSIITQRELHSDVPTFEEAIRRALRQDPDVILMGEMRDLETISAAITAAETGHLVFGTLHTTGSARTVDRIIDAFPPDQQEQIRAQLSVSIVAVISQVLMPRADKNGRIAAFEIMIMTPAIENHVRKSETFKITSAIQTSRRLGMLLLDENLFDLFKQGKIDRDTAMAFAQDPKDLATRLGA